MLPFTWRRTAGERHDPAAGRLADRAWLGAGLKRFGSGSYATDDVKHRTLDRTTIDVVRGVANVGEVLGPMLAGLL
jgi:hypothetical protein